MLAVNGNVSGYWEHYPVCNLQTVKSTELNRGFWGELDRWIVSPNCHLPWQDTCPWTLEFESMRTGCHPGRWADIQSGQLYSGNNFCQALVSLKCYFPHQYAPCPQSLEFESTRTVGLSWTLHYANSSCLVHTLGWKKSWNRPNGHKLPMKQILPDIFLTILMELDQPFCMISTFDQASQAAQVEASSGQVYLARPYWVTSTQSWGKLRAGVQLDLDLHGEHITT